MPRRRTQQINDTQLTKFVGNFIENGGNATQAALATRPSGYNTARSLGYRLMKRDDVKALIAQTLDEMKIDYKYVLGSHKQFVDKGIKQLNGEKKDNEPFVSPSDAYKHLQGIYTVMSVLGEKDGNEVSQGSKHLHLHLDSSNVSEIIKQRNASKTFFDDILGTKAVDSKDFQDLPE